MNSLFENSIPLHFLSSPSREDTRLLWGAGIEMDDFNYLIFAPPEFFEVSLDSNVCTPLDPRLDRLLYSRFGSENVWRLIEFKGAKVVVGVVYH